MADKQRMKCPKCGAPMNHHADKLVAPIDQDAASRVDPVFGGVIEETHTCLVCAYVEFRRASSS